MSSTASPILGSSASVVEAQVEIMSPVTYLQAHAELGVLLCTDHCSAYTLQNYDSSMGRGAKYLRTSHTAIALQGASSRPSNSVRMEVQHK